MADDPKVDEGPSGEPGLLEELPMGGLVGRLAALPSAAGQLPEPAEQAVVRPPSHQVPVSRGEGDDRGEDVRSFRPRPPIRETTGVREFLAGAAVGGDRARWAIRSPGSADELAELHQSLVEFARPVLRQLPLQHRP